MVQYTVGLLVAAVYALTIEFGPLQSSRSVHRSFRLPRLGSRSGRGHDLHHAPLSTSISEANLCGRNGNVCFSGLGACDLRVNPGHDVFGLTLQQVILGQSKHHDSN